MKAKTFANVWDALPDSPEEAATMKIRSDVMIAVSDAIGVWTPHRRGQRAASV